jgi:hypothetical protein
MKPTRSILDPSFRYTPSHKSDVAVGFARVKAGLPYRADGPMQTPTHISEFERRRREGRKP